jgi:hypothetical protein
MTNQARTPALIGGETVPAQQGSTDASRSPVARSVRVPHRVWIVYCGGAISGQWFLTHQGARHLQQGFEEQGVRVHVAPARVFAQKEEFE